METLITTNDCRKFRKEAASETLVLVPTMGALHKAHLSLIKLAKEQGNKVVVSIFVNPLQFGPSEDYYRYPRPLEADLKKCHSAGVDAVFTPNAELIYPEGEDNLTHVIPPSQLTEKLCGVTRPHFFTGVATVVLKLFNLIQPDIAVFGEKDAQQLAVIQKMARDLNFPTQIVAHPTVREENGLAISSRNNYLKTDLEKQAALTPSKILKRIHDKIAESRGENKNLKEPVFRAAVSETLAEMNGHSAAFTLEYLEAVSKETFESVNLLDQDCRILIAGKVGAVRLIDNIGLS